MKSLLASTLILASAAIAGAQQGPVVILDLTEKGIAAPAPAVGTDVTPENRTAVVAVGDVGALSDVQGASAALQTAQQNGNPTRVVTHRGEAVDILVFYDASCDEPKLDPSEKARESRIATDVETLKDVFKAVNAKSTVGNQAGVPKSKHFIYRIQRTRSDITLAASVKCGADTRKAEVTINGGPVEHLSLSADMPISKTADIKGLSGSGAGGADAAGTTASAPRRFYIAGNYTFGDIVAAPPKWMSLQNFSAKAMVLASKKPGDAYGFGIGYQFPAVDLFGLDLSTMGVFGAYFWEKADGSHERVSRPRFGVTFNLKKALDFLKSKS